MISCLASLYHGSDAYEFESCLMSLSQSVLLPDEFIIVQDGPVKADVIRVLDKYRLALNIIDIILPSSSGLGLALRTGLSHCTHQIICRIDTDDLYLPNHLSNAYKAFALDPSLDIYGTPVFEFQNISADSCLLSCKSVPCSNESIWSGLSFRNVINHPSVSFKKDSILFVGSYQPVMYFEDYFLWLKCRQSGHKFSNSTSCTVLMRRSSSLLSRRSGFQYFYCELKFSFLAFSCRLFAPFSLVVLLVRALFRLLPYQCQLLQNKLPWRSHNVRFSSPDNLIRLGHSLSTYSVFDLSRN